MSKKPACEHKTIRDLNHGVCVLCDSPKNPTKAALRLAGIAPELWQAERVKRSFDAFVEKFWPIIDAHPYKPNTASAAIIACLQAVADERIRRLAIEVPPGTGKSTFLALYGAWRIARDPAHRAIYASHAYTIAVNGLSLRTRRIVESEQFRSLFPAVELRSDENTTDVWATTTNGKFIAIGVGGALTGHRAAECIVDDPLNSIDAHSKATRDKCEKWFGESFSTRIDGEGPQIVQGQRLGSDDLIGRLKASGAKWTCLTLPAEFDKRRRCIVLADDGSEIWRDPRTDDGELLAPAILSAKKLDELRVAIGNAAFASQYNQDPASDENSMCPASRWRWYRASDATGKRPSGCDEGPAVEMPSIDKVVIAADLTFGSVKGDFAVVQAWGLKNNGRYLLEHFRKRCGFDEQVAAIRTLCTKYPNARVVVEKAANGAAVIETLQKTITNTVEAMVPVGNKAQRLAGVIGVIDNGQAFLPDGANYVADIVDEFQTFPGRHDDIVDCAVWALLALQTGVDHASRLQMKLDGMNKAFNQMLWPKYMSMPKIDPASIKRNEVARAKEEKERAEAEATRKIEHEAALELETRLKAEAEIRGFRDVKEMAMARSSWANMDAHQRDVYLQDNDDPTEPLDDGEIDDWLKPMPEIDLEQLLAARPRSW